MKGRHIGLYYYMLLYGISVSLVYIFVNILFMIIFHRPDIVVENKLTQRFI